MSEAGTKLKRIGGVGGNWKYGRREAFAGEDESLTCHVKFC